MKKQEVYIAREAFTFPLFCLICLAFNIYWDYTGECSLGAIIGTVFFGVVVIAYISKYICFGRNYLKIDTIGVVIKESGKITALKWSDIKKCEVYYRPTNIAATFFNRDLCIVIKSEEKQKDNIIVVSLSGKYCRNKGIIDAIKRFGGVDVFDSLSSRRQNRYLVGILLAAIMAALVLALISCNNRYDLMDNYSVYTYGEGLYGESETDYPIFASKLGYKEEPPFISNVKQVWWNSSDIIIEQSNGSWWIIAAEGKVLTSGDKFYGPLSIHQKDSIMRVERINASKMKFKNYE